MPKASVNEHDLSQSGKNEVRTPGQRFAVETKAISQAMRQTAYRHLWLGIR